MVLMKPDPNISKIKPTDTTLESQSNIFLPLCRNCNGTKLILKPKKFLSHPTEVYCENCTMTYQMDELKWSKI